MAGPAQRSAEQGRPPTMRGCHTDACVQCSASLCLWWPLVHHVEHPGPARLVEEMDDNAEEEPDTIGQRGTQVFSARGFERPIDEHRRADNIFTGHEAPEAAVETDVAIVAHGEDAVRRH